MRVFLCVCALVFAGAKPAAAAMRDHEAWIPEPMPPGFRVESTVIDGPVFADARGHTLYRWPFKVMRNGITGDARGESNCGNEKATLSGGLMSPYPPGLVMPELDTRPACTDVWPPALAPEGADAVGLWSVITRRDGRKQWAYDGGALYTSVLDQRPGDLIGSDSLLHRGDSPAMREPIGPASDLPPGFEVATTARGRILRTARGFTVYASDADARGKSRCDAACTATWQPMPAPASARPHGDWTVLERVSGERQWAFRGRPLYRHLPDPRPGSENGTETPGWQIVYLKEAPRPPAAFTIQVTTAGTVLADAKGHTIYTYACGDDAPDQLGCDHPTQPQLYRLALCGAGSPERCLRNFPYVQASRGARAAGLWSVVDIDPLSGGYARRGQQGALRVWAYRQRPVYTYAGDQRPGDIHADHYGELRAQRHGYSAFWLRNEYSRE
jgi:predicted lipoprotein with Yx(FWY)xxD motif